MHSGPKTLCADDLAHFTGTEHWYRHPLVPSVTYTDGARYVAQAGGAYWLLDEIAFAQRFNKLVAAAPFQLWRLTVDLDRQSAVLICEDGNNRPIAAKEITFTDFPLAEIRFYVTDNVILLPSEY
ncbi:DUF6876 family protein [Hyphomicrobium sp. MC8b]|uniref:DUF6876 family protein n=1 Tax=Hyphomicrobium sp. MC8b TaxID=300273 RepID=UPI00391BE92C